jgi:lipopolysaccharide transport system permease protein
MVSERHVDRVQATAPPPALAAIPSVTLIAPSGQQALLGMRDLFEFRGLLYFLMWRDIKVRYKQTALGVLWAVIQPLAQMVVFSIFFGQLGKLSQQSSVPYPLLTLCALIPWQFFATAVGQASNSLVANERLLTKVFFPRLIVPLAAVFGALFDFAISLVLLLFGMAYFGAVPSLRVLALPGFLLVAIVTALAVGLWLSALNVKYRDVRYAIPFVLQIWMFVSPVAYPASIVPPVWRTLYGLNPLAGVVEGFRWSLLGGEPPTPSLMGISFLMTMVLLVTGMAYFRRLEQTFADIV